MYESSFVHLYIDRRQYTKCYIKECPRLYNRVMYGEYI